MRLADSKNEAPPVKMEESNEKALPLQDADSENLHAVNQNAPVNPPIVPGRAGAPQPPALSFQPANLNLRQPLGLNFSRAGAPSAGLAALHHGPAANPAPQAPLPNHNPGHNFFPPRAIWSPPSQRITGHVPQLQNGNMLAGFGIPPPAHASPKTWLDHECQKRCLGYDIHYQQMVDGSWVCALVFPNWGVINNGHMRFPTSLEALNHAVTKAYQVVQGWGAVNPAEIFASNQELQGDRANEQDERNKRRRPNSSAEIDMKDPAQARAYVEGFRMGQLAALERRDGPSGERAAAPREQSPRRRSALREKPPSERVTLRSHSPKRSPGDSHHRRRSRFSAREPSGQCEKSPAPSHEGSRHEHWIPERAFPSTYRDRRGLAMPAAPEKQDSQVRVKGEDNFDGEG